MKCLSFKRRAAQFNSTEQNDNRGNRIAVYDFTSSSSRESGLMKLTDKASTGRNTQKVATD